MYSETKSRLLLHGRIKFISNCILKLNFQNLITVFSYIKFLNLYNHLFSNSTVEFVVYQNLFLKQIVILKVMWQWMFVCELSPQAWSQEEIGHSPPSSSTVKKVWNTCIFPHTFTAHKVAVPTQTSKQAKSVDNTRASWKVTANANY